MLEMLEIYGTVILIVFVVMAGAIFGTYFLARYGRSLETPAVVKADWKLVQVVIKEARHLSPMDADGNPGALPVFLLYMRACNERIDHSIKVGDRAAAASWREAFDLLNGATMVYSSFTQTDQ